MTLRDDLEASTGSRSLWRVLPACLVNPGFDAVLIYRGSARCAGRGVLAKILSILLWRLNIQLFACHLHPESHVGPGLALPHPCGVVLGKGVQVGARAKVYQGVTLGAAPDADGLDPHAYPRLGDDIVVYPNAVVAGAIEVGDRAVVGANSLVIRDVPPGALVGGVPASILRMPGSKDAS